MSNLPELSVEVWQTILRHSMFVPDFLDPASFEGTRAFESWFTHTLYSKLDEAVYWEVERHRNVLRLVCQTWNDYCNLPQFQHRFVRMHDVWHRRIGKEALKMTIRISFSEYWCLCDEICFPPREGGVSDPHEQYEQFCCQNIAALDYQRLQIAGMRGGIPLEKLLESGALQKIKQTKTLNASATSYESLNMLSSFTPDLNYLEVDMANVLGQAATFSSSTLVSLTLINQENNAYTIFNWNLPSLRHFRVRPFDRRSSSTFIGNVVTPILRLVGSQLRSLYIGYMTGEDGRMDEIWTLCPLLERLHPGGGLEATPPISHPIHTVSIHQDSIRRFLLETPASITRWPNLQKVIIDTQWPWVSPERRQYIWTRWKNEWGPMGIVLEDSLGTRLESYMESEA